MKRRGKVVRQVLYSVVRKSNTLNYPHIKSGMPKGFRGKIKFYPERCIGCKLCMRDCPSNAIHIKKVGENQFEAEFDLGKCIYCGQCVDSCLKKALEYTDEFELAQLDRTKLKINFHAEPKKPTEK